MGYWPAFLSLPLIAWVMLRLPLLLSFSSSLSSRNFPGNTSNFVIIHYSLLQNATQVTQWRTKFGLKQKLFEMKHYNLTIFIDQKVRSRLGASRLFISVALFSSYSVIITFCLAISSFNSLITIIRSSSSTGATIGFTGTFTSYVGIQVRVESKREFFSVDIGDPMLVWMVVLVFSFEVNSVIHSTDPFHMNPGWNVLSICKSSLGSMMDWGCYTSAARFLCNFHFLDINDNVCPRTAHRRIFTDMDCTIDSWHFHSSHIYHLDTQVSQTLNSVGFFSNTL